jgi:diphthamide synthase (EF-2-diphthine--ammonia ligase)
MDGDQQSNIVILQQISFHLRETARLCNQLDLSILSPLDQKEWAAKIKLCMDAIEFVRVSAQKLSEALLP